MSKLAHATAPQDTAPRRDELIGMYRLIAARSAGAYRAAAYAGMRRVELAEGETIDEAFAAVAALVAARIERQRRERADGWPTAEEYRDAIEATPLRDSQRLSALLLAHAQRPEARATWSELAQAAGVDTTAAKLEYARLGRKLAKFLDLEMDMAAGRDAAPLTTFTVGLTAGSASTTVQLRPEVVEALADL